MSMHPEVSSEGASMPSALVNRMPSRVGAGTGKALLPADVRSFLRHLCRSSILLSFLVGTCEGVTLTGSLSPSNPTVGITNVYLVGNATPGATVTNTVDTWPDGTTHGPYSATANGSGTYSMGPYTLQQLGTYHETIHDSISGQTINITYSGTGNFNASVNTTSQTVTRGSSASYTVTVSSVSGFAGTLNLAAL